MSQIVPQPYTFGALASAASLSGPNYQEFPLSSYLLTENERERPEFLGYYFTVGGITGRSKDIPAGTLNLNLALDGDSIGSHIPPGFSSGSTWESFSFMVTGPTSRRTNTGSAKGLWTLEVNLAATGDIEFTQVEFLAWAAPLFNY